MMLTAHIKSYCQTWTSAISYLEQHGCLTTPQQGQLQARSTFYGSSCLLCPQTRPKLTPWNQRRGVSCSRGPQTAMTANTQKMSLFHFGFDWFCLGVQQQLHLAPKVIEVPSKLTRPTAMQALGGLDHRGLCLSTCAFAIQVFPPPLCKGSPTLSASPRFSLLCWVTHMWVHSKPNADRTQLKQDCLKTCNHTKLGSPIAHKSSLACCSASCNY